ncbi:hypothetical protein [Sphingomonas sp. KRR8]|uniref:hypothetical protein n=1 Tax=Sphingomonas sp. KRR8 TaxID=2942996 RepID=UPI0032E7F63F
MRKAQAAGFTLEEIRELLEPDGSGDRSPGSSAHPSACRSTHDQDRAASASQRHADPPRSRMQPCKTRLLKECPQWVESRHTSYMYARSGSQAMCL